MTEQILEDERYCHYIGKMVGVEYCESFCEGLGDKKKGCKHISECERKEKEREKLIDSTN